MSLVTGYRGRFRSKNLPKINFHKFYMIQRNFRNFPHKFSNLVTSITINAQTFSVKYDIQVVKNFKLTSLDFQS